MIEMSHPDIQAALAREHRTMLLAEAENARLVRQARAARRDRGARDGHRSPVRRPLAWLPPVWSRLVARRSAAPESGYPTFS